MTADAHSDSRLSSPDSRPIVVTIVVVGFLLICGWGGLNAFVVLINGSTRVTLTQSSPERAIESFQIEEGWLTGELRPPDLIVLDRIFAAVCIVVAICGVSGAVGLLRRRSWSRALLWATAGVAVGSHALYTLRVLQIQTAEIANVFERQEVFEWVGTTSLINVAVQSIPLAVLAGLLRHPALRAYVWGATDVNAR